MTAPIRWLLVSNGRKDSGLAAALAARDAVVEAVDRAVDAVRRIEDGEVDAAVCIVEQPEDLSIVVRIRNARNYPPVLMLTSSTNPSLRELGRRMGASAVLSERPEAAETAAALTSALETRRLVAENRKRTREAANLGQQLKDLTEELKEGVTRARSLLSRRTFAILLVASEAPPTPPLLRALAEAGLPPFVRHFPSAEKAMEYLAGLGEFADRARHPLPALVLADEMLPGCGGLDLLAWMRMRSDAGDTPFVLLSDRSKSSSQAELRALEVEDCCSRTDDLAPLISRVRSIHARWLMADETRREG